MTGTERATDERAPVIRLFSSDLDGTLLGNPAATARFARVWAQLPAERRPVLVYNTGRTVLDTCGLVAARDLPQPDFVIGSVGTEVHDLRGRRTADFSPRLAAGWDLPVVERIVAATNKAKRQPAIFCSGFKSSWYWPRARAGEIDALRTQLGAAGVAVHIEYSCRHFLDVVPAAAGKGRALAWLCEQLNLPLAQVLVAGDSANDTSMFLLPEVRGILVGNALAELHDRVMGRGACVAHQPYADGVLEGLDYFGVTAREVDASDAVARSPDTRWR